MNQKKGTQEEQYNALYEVAEKHGISEFGIMANQSWNEDPKRTLFTLSRYKFVSKMLSGLNSALEIGCADAFGTRLVQQTVKNITVVDFDSLFIDDIKRRYNKYWPLNYHVHDLLTTPVDGEFDAVYCLDVLEHILPKDENLFIKNSIASIGRNGIFIAGMPSTESQAYASKQSKEGHVNCKSGEKFKEEMKQYFHNVFLFSMNDEVVHTGYAPMSQYLIVLCTGKK
jgi:2-polyprenyl-3-methyl-5-hydroxy-6-metoxy-1,4-benzoquinol methylase